MVSSANHMPSAAVGASMRTGKRFSLVIVPLPASQLGRSTVWTLARLDLSIAITCT